MKVTYSFSQDSIINSVGEFRPEEEVIFAAHFLRYDI